MSVPGGAVGPKRFTAESEELSSKLYPYLVFFSLPNVANPKIIGFDVNEKKDEFVNMVLKDHRATIVDGWLEVPTVADWIECLPFARDAGAIFLEFPKTPDAKAYTHAAHICMPDFKRRGLWLFAAETTKDEWIKTMLTFPDTRTVDNWLEVSSDDQLQIASERAKDVNGEAVPNYPSPDVIDTLPVTYKVHFCVDGDGFRILLQTITFRGDNDEKRIEFVSTVMEKLGGFERDGFLQVKDEAKVLEGDLIAASLGGVVSFYEGIIPNSAAMMPNPFSVGFQDARGHRAGITFTNMVQKSEWIMYAVVACGARKVGGDPNNYQSPTISQWARGLWKARHMGAEVIVYPKPAADDTSLPPIDFDLATAALLVQGSTIPRQLAFFPTSAIMDEYIQKLKEMGLVVDVTPYDITLAAEDDLAKADALATQLGGAFMDYVEEPEYHVEYIVAFSWPMGSSKSTIFFPSLLTMKSFICIMTKMRRGVEIDGDGWGIPISVGSVQDWEYGLQLANYLGGSSQNTEGQQNATFSQGGFVAILPSSIGWAKAGSPELNRKIAFDSEETEAEFERFAVVHLGATLVFDPQSQNMYLEVRSLLAWELGIFAAKARGGRVESEAAELVGSEIIHIPFFVNISTTKFTNKQHIIFPTATKGNAFVAKMLALGAIYVLGWLQVDGLAKLEQADKIAREMGGFVIDNPAVSRPKVDGVTAEDTNESASSEFIIFPARLRQANTSRRVAFLFDTYDTQQEFINKMLGLPGAEKVGEWIEVPSTEDWMLGLKTAHDLGGRLMPVEPEVTANDLSSGSDQSEIIIFPSGLRLPSAGREARWLFKDYETKEKFDDTMLDLRGAKRTGEWIDVETEIDWKVGLKLAKELDGVPDNNHEGSVSVSVAGGAGFSSSARSIYPPVYTHPVFYYHPGDKHHWAMVFPSKHTRDRFVLTMLDKDANMINGWLQPQDWLSGYRLTQQLEGIAVQLPRGITIAKVPKYTHVVDYYQAGSIKGQVLLFPTEEAKWRFEEALLGCWPGDARMVHGWLETIDSSVWLDGLTVAKTFGAVVLNMPEDRFVIY